MEALVGATCSGWVEALVGDRHGQVEALIGTLWLVEHWRLDFSTLLSHLHTASLDRYPDDQHICYCPNFYQRVNCKTCMCSMSKD